MRERNVVLNIAAAAFSKGSIALCRLVSIPILLSFWDTHTLGVWILLASVPGWLALSDVGLGTVVANEMVLETTNSRRLIALGIFKGAFWMLCVIVVLMSGAFCTIASWVSWRSVFSIPPEVELPHPAVVVSLLTIACLISMFRSLFQGLYRIADRNHLGVGLANLGIWFELMGMLIAISFSREISIVAIGWAIGRVVHTVAFCCYGVVLVGFREIRVQGSRFERTGRMIKCGAAFCLFPIGYAIIMDGSSMIVNVLLGPAWVVAFSTMRMLARIGSQGTELLKQGVYHELCCAIALGDKNRESQILKRGTILSTVAAVLIAGAMLLWGPVLFQHITKGKSGFVWPAFILLVMSIIPNSLWNYAIVALEATNRHSNIALQFLLSALGFALAFYFSVKLGGLTCGCVSVVGFEILMCLLLSLQVRSWRNGILN